MYIVEDKVLVYLSFLRHMWRYMPCVRPFRAASVYTPSRLLTAAPKLRYSGKYTP